MSIPVADRVHRRPCRCGLYRNTAFGDASSRSTQETAESAKHKLEEAKGLYEQWRGKSGGDQAHTIAGDSGSNNPTGTLLTLALEIAMGPTYHTARRPVSFLRIAFFFPWYFRISYNTHAQEPPLNVTQCMSIADLTM
jgi:hypothetical protein